LYVDSGTNSHALAFANNVANKFTVNNTDTFADTAAISTSHVWTKHVPYSFSNALSHHVSNTITDTVPNNSTKLGSVCSANNIPNVVTFDRTFDEPHYNTNCHTISIAINKSHHRPVFDMGVFVRL
jgi:hypothetical protein